MIGHEAIAKEPKRIAFASLEKGVKKRSPVPVIAKNVGAVVAAVDGVINQPIVSRSR
jgi:hypothetical protein